MDKMEPLYGRQCRDLLEMNLQLLLYPKQEGKDMRIQILTSQFIVGASPVVGKVGPRPQELPPQEAVSFHPDDEDSNNLDLEQLLEEEG
ncbi:hypothetical protein MC885_007089 [Smutsia gigantea]|nr:hypothetical protein MC885_007089 [Smutsia gigantea]